MGGHYDIVQLLLNNGADRSTANDYGYTALVKAARGGHDKIVQLLSEEADNTSVHNKELYEAAARGDSTGVQSALSQGANVDYQNPKEYGGTSLHVAARGGYHDVVRILLSVAANVNLVNTEEDTALIEAARGGHCDVVELLLKKGADPSHSNYIYYGNTVLIVAAEEGHYDIVQLLLNNGADRRTANYRVSTANYRDGNTALIVAADRGHYDIVQLLLNSGADRSTANRISGETALAVAARKGYDNIVQLLSEEPHQNMTTHNTTQSSTLPSASAGLNQTNKDTTSVDDVAAITEKLEELQSYLPQMSEMIDKMEKSGPSNQLNKLSNLYKVIKTKTTSISMSTLEKSHVVLKRMFPEDSSNTDSIKGKASTNATFAEIDQIYLQEAMEDGLIESFVTKAVVQGEARVGKSSVKSLLVAEPYTDSTSTNCIESPCVAVKCYGQTGKYWERIDEEEMGIKVIAAVQSGAIKKSEYQSHVEEMDHDFKSKSNTKKQQKHPSKASKIRTESAPMDDDYSSSAVTSGASATPMIELTSDSNEKDAVVRVRKFYRKCKMNQKEGTSLHGRRWLYFIDSGGQIQFQKLLPAFMPYASVLLLVVNLSKNLNEPSSTAMQLSEREISVGQHSLSVIEILKHLLSAIASSAQRYRSLIADDPVLSKCITPPSDKLKVLPVATHHDKYEEALKDGKESIVDKKITINEIFHRHETCEIVGREGEIYLYEVDGRKARDKVFENLQPDSDLYKIAQALEDNAYQIKVPLKWYCFGVLLHDVAKEGCGVLSLSYCQELGQQLKVNLSPEESLSAIKFLSFLNKLLFYPDSPAGDLVFVNIESLINVLRDLLVFICDTHSKTKLLLPDQKALVCKGHLSIKILKKASESCNKISEEFSDFDAKLLGLFEYLLIAAKLPEKESFFMPALLPIKDVSGINPYPNTTPLLLYFENAIPMGLFCAVIVHLLSLKESPWKVIEESNFSNYFTLSQPGYLEGKLILVEQLDCIALFCKLTNEYILARDAVEEAVNIAMSKHKLSACEKPKRGFYCPCGNLGRHVAQAIWLIPQERYILSCTIDKESQVFPNDCWNWLENKRIKRPHNQLQNLPDIFESNIASKVLVDSTEEIKNYFSQDFSQIADKLLQKNVITVAEKAYLTDRNTRQSEDERMDELLKLVTKSVQVEASIFSVFVEIFREKGTLAAIKFAEELTRRYEKLSLDVNMESFSKRQKL